MKGAADMLMLTNNPKVAKMVSSQNVCALSVVSGGIRDVFVEARNLIHKGHKLISHPLSGSVKPNHGLYKSLILSEKAFEGVDFESLEIIEGAISTLDKLGFVPLEVRERFREDFELIDFTLIMSNLDIGITNLL